MCALEPKSGTRANRSPGGSIDYRANAMIPPTTASPIDGRTLMTLVSAAERYLGRFPGDYSDKAALEAAIFNVKLAMEHVFFRVSHE